MPTYYCLAKTSVNGEIVIQGSSVTYSASASALDSSNKSFKDAAKVATINSNTAATLAARKEVDNILTQYAYVLSDETITSMISNSLKTTLRPIIPIALKKIASTVDGINYVLNRDTTIKKDQLLRVSYGKNFLIPENLKFNNNGIFQIGVYKNRDKNKNGSLNTKSTDYQASVTLSMNCAGNTNTGTISIGTSTTIGNDTATLTINSSSTTCSPTQTFLNTGSILLNSGGKLVNSAVYLKNGAAGTTTLYDGAIGIYSSSTVV